MKDTGLTEKEWEQIRAVLRVVPAIEKAVLFGSRAMGLARGNSDVDIILYGEELTMGDVAHVRALLEETTLPYQFDLVLHDAGNKALQEHVRQYGKIVVDRNLFITNDTWREYKLEDCLDALIDYRGKTPIKTDSGIPLITAKIIKDGTILPPTEFISHNDYSSWMRRGIPQAGDIVLTTEAPLGEVAQLDDKKVALAQRVVTLRGKKGCLDNTFLLYLLQTEEMQDKLKARSTGTTVLGIKQSELRKIPVIIPPLPFQIHAVSYLKNLDDRIQLLRETNATLEAMAQALFKSWFVDFDPVHAKVEGRAPEGMDAETAALFPHEFEESEQRMIPKGWKNCPLTDIACYLNGIALQKYPTNGTAFLPVIKIAQLRKGDTVGADRASTSIPNEYIIHDGDVLFSWSGTLEVELWCGGVGALNQHIFKIFSDDYPKWFYYFWTKHHLGAFRQIASDKATTMGHIQRKHLVAAQAIVPSNKSFDKFNTIFSPIVFQLINNSIKARTLTALRDTLLPRLISGKLRLPEFAEVTDEATV